MAEIDLDQLERQLQLLEYQTFKGCGDPKCEKPPCLTYRSRQSTKPFRRPTRITARNQALTILARVPDAQSLICSSLLSSPDRNLPTLTPGRTDPSSFLQAFVSSKEINALFEGERKTRDPNLSKLLHNDHILCEDKAVWPLPHPQVTASAWMHYVVSPRQSQTEIDYEQMVDFIFRPPGYELPSARYEASVVRAISLFKMQKAVEHADYHFDLLVRPPGFVLDQKLAALPTDHHAPELGITRNASTLANVSADLCLGMHTITRRWLSLVASRVAPFAALCDQVQNIQPHQAPLPLRVAWQSVGEEGVDQGGLAQEFFQEASLEAFSPPLDLFVETEEDSGLYWPHVAGITENHLELYWCFGVLMGLAVHNGYILPVNFPTLFYEKLKGTKHEPALDVLAEAWPGKRSVLNQLLKNPAEPMDMEYILSIPLPPHELPHGALTIPFPTAGDVTSPHYRLEITLDSDYAVSLIDDETSWKPEAFNHFVLPRSSDSDAGPSESSTSVTDVNKHVYVRDYIRFLTHVTVSRQFQAMKLGLQAVISADLIHAITPDGLRLAVEGDPHVSIDRLRECVRLREYQCASLPIRWFWEIVAEWPPADVRKLLQFVTGCERLPVQVDARRPAFTITRFHSVTGNQYLPSASTCSKELYLPAYENVEKTREMLAWILVDQTGFRRP